MPNRILREGILSSERIALLTWPAEVFYRRLHSVVDDFGRFYATPMLLRAACYPLQLDKVSDTDIGRWLEEARNTGLIRVFESGGKQYLEVLDFRQQVRATKSRFPQPPTVDAQTLCECVADAKQVIADAHLDVSVSVVECVAAPKSRKRSKTAIPENFSPSEAVVVWAKEHGYERLQEHLDCFRLKCAAHDYRYANWDAAFQAAIEADWAKINRQSPPGNEFAGVL